MHQTPSAKEHRNDRKKDSQNHRAAGRAPDIIECDGMAYVVRRTCRPVHFEGDTLCSHCKDYMDESRNFCGTCGALICDEAPMERPLRQTRRSPYSSRC